MFSDSCLLRHFTRNIILLVYVDDICIEARSLDQISWFKNEFNKIFKIKNLKKMKKILDIRITRDKKIVYFEWIKRITWKKLSKN